MPFGKWVSAQIRRADLRLEPPAPEILVREQPDAHRRFVKHEALAGEIGRDDAAAFFENLLD